MPWSTPPAESRARIPSPPAMQRKLSPLPFRRAPSAVDMMAARNLGITAISPHDDARGRPARRGFGSGQTQANLTRPIRTALATGVSLVRPQATAWQAFPALT